MLYFLLCLLYDVFLSAVTRPNVFATLFQCALDLQKETEAVIRL